MKFPLSWLSEYIDIDLSPEEIGQILTSAGIEVDSIESIVDEALNTDVIFEVSLTPNLGHCASLIGIARELSAATQKPVRYPKIQFEESEWSTTSSAIRVTVEDSKACPRYTCRVIKDLLIGPSPAWLQRRLIASGLRPINNIVDVTQYVVLERGLPLHAFDYEKIEGQQIIVRSARAEESLTTLDDRKRELNKEDLLICDGSGPICLAGIMGGKNSEVSETTTHVLLEAAYFNPSVIRKTNKRLGLSTDASKRFERGCDPNEPITSLNRAAMLLEELAGGKPCQGYLDVAVKSFPDKEISCRFNRLQELLGIPFGVSEVEEIFHRLDFSVKWDGDNLFLLKIPTYRSDISSEVDLIEEVARVYGYNNIRKKQTAYEVSLLGHTPLFLYERGVRNQLIAEGLQEFLTCDLIGPTLLATVKELPFPADSTIKVLNPTSIEQSILRTSLLPGILQVIKHNIDHQTVDIHGFEVGRIHFKTKEEYKEQSNVAIFLTGQREPSHWDYKGKEVDFYDLKGIVENLLKGLNVSSVDYKVSSLTIFHTGRQAAIYVGALEIGSLGEIHPAILRRMDIGQRVLFAELNLQDLMRVGLSEQKMKEFSKYPGSERDWTLSIPEKISFEEIRSYVSSVPSSLLENLTLLDIYRNEALGQGIKNITLRFMYRDQEKTIEQEAVDSEHARITTTVFRMLPQTNNQ
jgi:phenylalanyl-tRNA synthetase beta chain